MAKKNSLSVVISVYNGEKVLEDCLKSVAFAEEIIVIENSSTDRTPEIAKRYTDKIFTRINNPMLNINKNFGFSKASGDWILCLDADERVTPELGDEIRNLKLDNNGKINGYWIPRKNIIFGKWIEHTGWYPDYQLRLFKKNKGKFLEKHVHEMIQVNGETEYLKNNLLHYNYSSISEFLGKLNIYVKNEAGQLIANGYEFKWQDAIAVPVKEFLSRYFAREGYKDGFHGLMLSFLMAFYHLLVTATVWEERDFEKIEISVDKEIKGEFKKAYRDLMYWIADEKIKRIKNPFKRTYYKILRKIHAK